MRRGPEPGRVGPGEPVGEPGTDTGRHRLAEELPGGVDAGGVVEEEGVLEGDRLPLHALHLGDVGDPSGAVAQPGELDDDVDGRGDLLPDGAQRQVHAGHEHEGLQARDPVPRRVCVHRRDAAGVSGVQDVLDVVEGFVAAQFS